MKDLKDIINEAKSTPLFVYFEFGQSGWGAQPIIRIEDDSEEAVRTYSMTWTKEAWLYRIITDQDKKKVYATFSKLTDWKDQEKFEKVTLNDICQEWDKVKIPAGKEWNDLKKLANSL